jgi:hypothetical protein
MTLFLAIRYFAGEIIGKLLEIEPRKWHRPRVIDSWKNRERVLHFRTKYDEFDWTHLLVQ